MNCFQRDSLKGRLRLSALHGSNACTRNLGDRLRGCWQRKEWILSFLSLPTQRVLIHQISSQILDIDCCVPQGSCLGQILFIMYVSSIFNGVKNHLPSIHAYAYDIRCICPPSLCWHLRNMMRSENLAKLVQLTFERGWSPTDSR